MSRYTDVNMIIKKYINTDIEKFSNSDVKIVLKNLKQNILKAPSIDICFCGECVKANTENCSHSYWDDDWGVWRIGYKGDDWFCADGEREGE